MTDQDVIEVKIDGRVHRCPAAVFRRLLTGTRSTLERLKSEEGRMFPQIDRAALDFINEVQFRHRSLI